jgi:GlpG protein
MIGHLPSESDARVFADFLYIKGIKNEIEEENARWLIWVHGEDEIETAKDLLQDFRQRSADPEFRRASKHARELREQEAAREAAAAKRFFDGRKLFRRHEAFGIGRVTLVLIVLSIVAVVLGGMDQSGQVDRILMISQLNAGSFSGRLANGMHEVTRGQLWRLLTPIFIHYGILHIVLNMYMLRHLGSTVEFKEGPVKFGALVVVIGIVSNVAQYYVSGPNFGGMSGVNYGLLGFIWMKATYDPGSGYFLQESMVVIMLIWLLLGFTGFMHMANTVHTVGLVTGMAWGYLTSRSR